MVKRTNNSLYVGLDKYGDLVVKNLSFGSLNSPTDLRIMVIEDSELSPMYYRYQNLGKLRLQNNVVKLNSFEYEEVESLLKYLTGRNDLPMNRLLEEVTDYDALKVDELLYQLSYKDYVDMNIDDISKDFNNKFQEHLSKAYKEYKKLYESIDIKDKV